MVPVIAKTGNDPDAVLPPSRLALSADPEIEKAAPPSVVDESFWIVGAGAEINTPVCDVTPKVSLVNDIDPVVLALTLIVANSTVVYPRLTEPLSLTEIPSSHPPSDFHSRCRPRRCCH